MKSYCLAQHIPVQSPECGGLRYESIPTKEALWDKYYTEAPARQRQIQHRQESIAVLAKRYEINHKTVAKWKKRGFTHDAPRGPKAPGSTGLSLEEETLIVVFRKHTLLPLDDCLYALQATIPHLTRSSLHRCLKRHGTSRLPEVEGDNPKKKKFKKYPIGYFHIDIAEMRTEEGKLYLFASD